MAPIANPKVEIVVLDKIKTFIKENVVEIKAATLATLDKLTNLPHTRSLTELVDKENRIYEAKVGVTDHWIRIFWFWYKPSGQNSKVVATHAYLKKENKTDPNEIKVAKKIKNNYEAQQADIYKQQKKRH